MSFAALAKNLKAHSTVVTFDYRGHGDNTQDNETDMSEETLIRDTLEVLAHVSQKFREASIIMVGHSMGGSIATKTTHKILLEHVHEEMSKQIQGLYVIDVVEGSAMDALPFMENIVNSRPPEFKSVQSAI